MTDDSAETELEWMSAAAALTLVQERNGHGDAAISICTRAYAGMVKTQAIQFRQEFPRDEGSNRKTIRSDVALPEKFWWAKGQGALTANWATGDFSTWIDQSYLWEAFGVEFSKEDIVKMLVPAPAASPAPAPRVEHWIPLRDAIQILAERLGSVAEARAVFIQRAGSGELAVIARKMRRAVPNGDGELKDKWPVDQAMWHHFGDHSDSEWWRGDLTATYSEQAAHSNYLHPDTQTLELIDLTVEAVQLGEAVDLLPPRPQHALIDIPRLEPAAAPTRVQANGRPAAAWWAAFAEELTMYIHHNGPPDGAGTAGQTEVADAVFKMIAEHHPEIPEPGRSSITPVINAVLIRLRSGK